MKNNYKYKYKVYKTYHKRFTSPFMGKFFSLDMDSLSLPFIHNDKESLTNIVLKHLHEKTQSIIYYNEYVDTSIESTKLRETYYDLLSKFNNWIEIFYTSIMSYPLSEAISNTFKNVFIPLEDLMYSYTKQEPIFIVAIKKAYLEYLSQHSDAPIILAAKDFFEEGFIEIDKNIAAWYITDDKISKDDMLLLKDKAIVYNKPVFFSKKHAIEFMSGDTLGYLHKSDTFIINPKDNQVEQIRAEISERASIFETQFDQVKGKPQIIFSITKFSDLDANDFINISNTTYVLLERFLYKFHSDRNVFNDLMSKISTSGYQKIILKFPHLTKDFVDGTIRMDDLEGLEQNQYNKNIDLYERIFKSLELISNKEIFIAVPFIRDEEEFLWHRREIEAFLDTVEIKASKIGALLQTDSLTDNVSSINRNNKFDFVILDSNEIFQEVYDVSRFSYFEYFEYIRNMYYEIRALHENLDNRNYEQFFHGYLLSQPKLARKMYNSGIKNIIIYRSQAFNFYKNIIKSKGNALENKEHSAPK